MLVRQHGGCGNSDKPEPKSEFDSFRRVLAARENHQRRKYDVQRWHQVVRMIQHEHRSVRQLVSLRHYTFEAQGNNNQINAATNRASIAARASRRARSRVIVKIGKQNSNSIDA